LKSPLRCLLLCFGVWLCLVWQPQTIFGQGNDLIISRMGLSQTRGTTFLTMLLSRAQQPRIQPVVDRQSPKLIIDFPKARVFDVPALQMGDQQLVNQVRTMAIPGEDGVRIVLDLVPDRPYTFWRSGRPGPVGGYQFMIGLKPDTELDKAPSPGLAVDRPPSTYTREPVPALPPPRDYPIRPEAAPSPEDRRTYETALPPGFEQRRPTSGPMSEIYQLMPAAGPVLAFLEQQGWSVDKRAPGRGGSQGAEKFTLSSSRFPELSLKIEHIPTRASGGPAINLIALATDRLADPVAEKYRGKVDWDMAKIKANYEDIGDYFDDGLKPLRIKLREMSKAVVLRNFEFYEKFLQAAAPQKPGLVEQIDKHIREKVNKRFEGAQFTESERPLVILDLVDFYTIRVYFIGG